MVQMINKKFGDVLDSKSSGPCVRVGSSPTSGTKYPLNLITPPIDFTANLLQQSL